jgi:hypothetical protein
MLVGDSHAGQWTEALGRAAADNDMVLVSRWHSACPAISVNIKDERGTTPTALTEQCTAFRRDTLRLIEELKPTAVILSQSNLYLPYILDDDLGSIDVSRRISLWRNAYTDFLTAQRDLGVRPAVILDNPSFAKDPIECVSRKRSAEGCDQPRQAGLGGIRQLQTAETGALRELGGIPSFTVVDEICDEVRCNVELDDTLVFSDNSHLTTAFSLLEQPRLADFLRVVTSS